jgi:hypothetical protein
VVANACGSALAAALILHLQRPIAEHQAGIAEPGKLRIAASAIGFEAFARASAALLW